MGNPAVKAGLQEIGTVLGGRSRAFDVLIQRQAPYRLATPHCPSTTIAVCVPRSASQVTRHKCGQVTIGWVT